TDFLPDINSTRTEHCGVDYIDMVGGEHRDQAVRGRDAVKGVKDSGHGNSGPLIVTFTYRTCHVDIFQEEDASGADIGHKIHQVIVRLDSRQVDDENVHVQFMGQRGGYTALSGPRSAL